MAKKLEVNNLIISFRTNNGTVKAVRDISFDLEKGETLAIVGESGSGKSVTARAIMGILAKNAIPEGGEIIYDGQDPTRAWPNTPPSNFYLWITRKSGKTWSQPLLRKAWTITASAIHSPILQALLMVFSLMNSCPIGGTAFAQAKPFPM